MTESMIERVARAVVENPPEERQESTPDGWRIIRNFERTARAAIEAMRDPTDAMKDAMTAAALDSEYGALRYEVPDEEIQRVFTAMINAALEEKP